MPVIGCQTAHFLSSNLLLIQHLSAVFASFSALKSWIRIVRWTHAIDWASLQQEATNRTGLHTAWGFCVWIRPIWFLLLGFKANWDIWFLPDDSVTNSQETAALPQRSALPNQGWSRKSAAFITSYSIIACFYFLYLKHFQLPWNVLYK